MAERAPVLPERLPNSLEAEEAVLGCALTQRDTVNYIRSELAPNDFYYPAHAAVFETVIRLLDAESPVDIISVTDDLDKRGLLERVGGVPFLTSLSAKVPYLQNVQFYVGLVREKSRLRELMRTLADLSAAAYREDQPVSDLLDIAAERLFAIREGQLARGFSRIGDVMMDRLNELLAMVERKEYPYLHTGFASLDQLIGGLRKGALYILAARPGMGKSAFAFNIAQRITSLYEIPSAIFSLEMSKEEVSTRFLSTFALIDSKKLTTGNLSPQEWDLIEERATKFFSSAIYIDDAAAVTPGEMLSRCRDFRLREPKLGLVIVDYLQLMSSSRQRQDNRQQEISDISRNLKILARELDLPVIALSQLSRASEARTNKRPMLSDLRDSGAIEQDADVVLFLYRDDYYQQTGEEAGEGSPAESSGQAELIVAKNRQGATGTVYLGWKPEYTLFYDLDDKLGSWAAPPLPRAAE